MLHGAWGRINIAKILDFLFRSRHRRCPVKKVFLKISQISQEETGVGVSFLIKLQAWMFSDELNLSFFCKLPYASVAASKSCCIDILVSQTRVQLLNFNGVLSQDMLSLAPSHNDTIECFHNISNCSSKIILLYECFFSEKIRSLIFKNNSRWSLMTILPKDRKKHKEDIKTISFIYISWRKDFLEKKNTQQRRIQNSVEHLQWRFFVKIVNV